MSAAEERSDPLSRLFATPEEMNKRLAKELKEARELGEYGDRMGDGFRRSDVGNAERLVAVADGSIRYVHAWGSWIVYVDGTWQLDPGRVLVTEVAKLVAVRMRQMIGEGTVTGRDRDMLYAWQKRCESASAIAAMIKLAAGIPGVLVNHEDLDQHPKLLNVANGTVNLRTGELGPHDPEHLLTKQAPVVYDPNATAPLWEHCLARWQPDPTMRAYLQLTAGAAATGYPVEEFHVHHGGGANGKGKFFRALMDVLGPYAVVPHKSLLVLTKHEQHETVMADLFGARLAVAAETARSERLNEEKVKALTGADWLSARRMHENRWKFRPTHLLALHTNHVPTPQSSDEAMRRRLRLIPWDVTIPEAERDDDLPSKLLREASGILNWIVEGARIWLEHDRQLPVPPPVAEVTDTLFRQADPVGWFLARATASGDDLSVTTRELHEAYNYWRTDPSHGDEQPRPVSQTELGTYVRDRGYRKAVLRVDGTQAKGWRGLALNPAYREAVEWARVQAPDRVRDQGVPPLPGPGI